jgi:hypothetical protein
MSGNLIGTLMDFSTINRITEDGFNYFEIYEPYKAVIRSFKDFGNEQFWDKLIRFDTEN